MLKEFLDPDTLSSIQNKAVTKKIFTFICDSVRELGPNFTISDDLHDLSSICAVLYPWWFARQHFYYAAAKRPDIARFTGNLSL